MEVERPKTAPEQGAQRSEPILLLQQQKRSTKLMRVGGAFDMPTESTGERFARFFFPLSDVPDSPTFFGQNTVSAGTQRENIPGMVSTIKTRSNLNLEGRAQTRLPFYGHYDVVTGWDIDDPGLDASAYSPNLGYQRMQMALVPFKHAEPTPCISELYTRPVSARFGAEGLTIRRLPEDPLASDEYTREALLWKKYATRHTGQSVDVQELAKWVLQLHPRCVQDFKPMLILLQGIVKDLLHEKMLLFAGENKMLRKRLDEAQIQSKKELDEAQEIINSLMEQLASAESQARVKDKFQSALHKLNGVSKQMTEQRHEADIKKALEEQVKKEMEIFRKNETLKAEVDKLQARVDDMRQGNLKLNKAQVAASKTMEDQKLALEEANKRILKLEKAVAESKSQAKIRAATTAKWSHAVAISNETKAGLVKILTRQELENGAKADWIAGAGIEIGPVALAALSEGVGVKDAADALLNLPEHDMHIYLRNMPPQESGPIIKEVLMKSVEDTSETLTKRVCASLSALGAVQAGYVLAHTPSPVTMRIVKHFKDQGDVEAAMSQWKQCQASLSKARQSLVDPELPSGDDVDANIRHAESSIHQSAETLDSMDSKYLFHLLSTAPGDVGETLMEHMSISTVNSLRKLQSTITQKHERIEKAISKFIEDGMQWKLSTKCESAVEALKNVQDFNDLTENAQELLVAVKQDHGVSLTVMNNCEDLSGDTSSTLSEGQMSESMLVIGSTETGEALSDAQIDAAGINSIASEVARQNIKDLQDCVVSGTTAGTMTRVGRHVVQLVYVHGAQENGELSKNADVKWGAITCSSTGTSTDDNGSSKHDCDCSGLQNANLPVEAAILLVSLAITAAAQRLEKDEAELMGIAQSVEDSIEGAGPDGEARTARFAKLEAFRDLPEEKKVKIIRMVSARIVKRLRMAGMQQQLRELKSYKSPPYKVLCIVTSLFILLDIEGLEHYLGKLHRIPKDGSSDLVPLWKFIRSKMDIKSVLKAMGSLGTPSKDRAGAVNDILMHISHGDAEQASRAICELRKWCIVKAGSFADGDVSTTDEG